MRTTLLALLGLSLFACRGGGGGGGGDDDDTPPDGPPGGRVTIQQVQSDDMPVGTPVTLEGVVVTAIDSFGARTGDLWVEDPAGGEFSGIKVFGAPLDQVAALKPGFIVTISNAEKDEFALTADTSGRTVTEIGGAAGGQLSIVKTGEGALPAPVEVDALAIGMLDLAARDVEWEKYEGVLISVVNAKALTNDGTFGDGADDQHEFKITGDARVQSAMSALPENAVAGDCYANLVGIGDYFFNWLVLPREPTDLAANGATCAPEEEGDAACGDDLDNDGDGFSDCDDFSCQATASACSTTTTISEIQAGTATGVVTVQGVFVTALGTDQQKLWISTSLTAAPNEGLLAFSGPQLDPDMFAPGVKVNVTGTVGEFNDDMQGASLTELNQPTITLQADPAGVVVPATGKTAAQLLDPATAAMFESVMVTLTNVELTAIGNDANGFVATANQGGTTFKVGTDIKHLAADDLGCYPAVTGVWTSLQSPSPDATTKPNAFGFNVLTLGAKDATGAACD